MKPISIWYNYYCGVQQICVKLKDKKEWHLGLLKTVVEAQDIFDKAQGFQDEDWEKDQVSRFGG